jgi:DNA-binding NtrC family response regulator
MARILIFERDADLCKLLRMVLQSDYQITEVGDIEAALDVLRASSPLVVVLGDWPSGASGEQVLCAVENDATLRRHVYILVSMNHDGLAPALRELLTCLAVPVVPMPCDLRVLQATVRHACARVGMPRRARRGVAAVYSS